MLRVSLSDLRGGAVETVGEVPADDPQFATEDVHLASPIKVRGRLSPAGDGQYYWQGQFEATLRAECRRCLTSVDVPLAESVGLVFATDPKATEAEGYYLIPARAQEINLREALREEFTLALPHYVECRPDCKGLCPTCGANLNEGPCGCAKPEDPRWAALRGLTTKPKD